jgi:uncharacterized protein YcfJ
MKNLKISSLIIVLSILSGCSSTPPTHTKHDVVATVVNSQPAPKVCVLKNEHSSGTRLASAIIGGIAGNQFGSGTGRDIMTVVGVGVGYAATSGKEDKYTCKSNGFITHVIFDNPFSRRTERRAMKTHSQEYKGTEIEVVYNHPITMVRTNR